MPTLRKCLILPHTYLLLCAGLLLSVGLDTLRSPQRQVTARAYIGAVREYQRYVRPLLRECIRCRYRPTCSEYSVQAVRKHGIRFGLVASGKRVLSCKRTVPMNTLDTVR